MATNPRRQRRPSSFDPSLAWAGLAVVGVAAIIGIAILLTRPTPVEAPGGEPPAASSSATPMAALTIPGAPATVEEGSWFRFGWRRGDEQADGSTLRIGRLDSTVTAELDVPRDGPIAMAGYGPPFVRGPRHGLVLIVSGTATAASLQRVEVATGRVDDLLTVDGLVPDAVLGEDASFVYYLVTSGDRLGAARVRTDGTGPAEDVAPPVPRVALGGGVTLAAAIQRHASLVLNDDETQLAILDCFASCTVRIVTLSTGEEQRSEGLEGWARLDGWNDAGIATGQVCIDPNTGLPVEAEDCPVADPLRGFSTGVELPDGWRAALKPVAGVPPINAMLNAVAIGPDGEEIVLDALGDFFGNG